jgi:hypothetical protein
MTYLLLNTKSLARSRICLSEERTTRTSPQGSASSNGAHSSCWPSAGLPLPAPDLVAHSTRGGGATRHFTGPSTGNDGPASNPLGLSQTSLGQAGLLLVPRTLGQGWTHKRNLLLLAPGLPDQSHPSQHNGQEYPQRGVPFLLPCTASGPNLTLQNSGSCCC